jgi:putative transposase
VQRLKRELGLRGVRRGRFKRTTIPDEQARKPAGLVMRVLRDRAQPAVGRRHHHIATLSGFVRLHLVHHRRLLPGDRLVASSRSLRAVLALDALEMAIWLDVTCGN